MRLPSSTTILSVIAGMLLVVVLLLFHAPTRASASERSYSDLLRMEQRLKSATIVGDELVESDEEGVVTVRLPKGSSIADRPAQAGTDVTIPETPDVSGIVSLLTNWLPLLAYLIVLGVPLFRMARALETLAKQAGISQDETM